MLGKLIKYEFDATKTVCLVCNIGMLVLAILGGLLFLVDPSTAVAPGGKNTLTSAVTTASVQINGSNDIGFILAKLGYVVLCIISIIAVCIVLKYYFFFRYYKNYFTDEGYLMHTLPVTSKQLIASKLIVATLWQYITAILTFGCVVALICGAMANLDMWSGMRDYFIEGYKSYVNTEEFAQSVPVFICFIIILLVTPIAYNLYMYLAVSIGQKAKSNKLLASIGMLAALYVVRKFVFTLINFGAPSRRIAFWGGVVSENGSYAEGTVYAILYVVFMIAVSIGLFFWNNHLMEKQLNLE